MSKYKYWSITKLESLLRELRLGFGGVGSKDIQFRHHIEDLIAIKKEKYKEQG